MDKKEKKGFGMKLTVSNFEYAYIFLFLFLFLYLGCANLFDNKISHDFPYGYLASNTFQHQTRVEGIKNEGGYNFEPFYIVKGYKDVVGYYPPIIYHAGIIFSYMSGLQTYDGLYFLVFFFAGMASVTMYFFIRKFSRDAALLSLPIMLLLFSQKPYIGFVWGHWPSLTAQYLLVAFFLAVTLAAIEYRWLVYGILFTGVMLSHTSEFVFLGIFTIIYLVYLLITKNRFIEELKNVIYGGILAVAVSAYYLLIFYNSWMKTQPYEFHITTNWGGTPILMLGDFGYFVLFFMMLGVVYFAVMTYSKKNEKKAGKNKIEKEENIGKNLHLIPLLVSAFALIVGYANYFGFDFRAYQSRFFWPIYLSALFGFGILIAIDLLKVRKKSVIFGVSIAAILLFSGFVSSGGALPAYSKINSPGLMNLNEWQSFKWIQDNTNSEDKIFFLYGDVYNQDAILRNAERVPFLAFETDIIDAIQNRTVKRYYNTEISTDSGAGFPYRKSAFILGMHSGEKSNENFNAPGVYDICSFDYVVFDKASVQPVLAQYNIIVANDMIKTGWIKPVYQNDLAVILKNEKPGVDCLEERSI